MDLWLCCVQNCLLSVPVRIQTPLISVGMWVVCAAAEFQTTLLCGRLDWPSVLRWLLSTCGEAALIWHSFQKQTSNAAFWSLRTWQRSTGVLSAPNPPLGAFSFVDNRPTVFFNETGVLIVGSRSLLPSICRVVSSALLIFPFSLFNCSYTPLNSPLNFSTNNSHGVIWKTCSSEKPTASHSRGQQEAASGNEWGGKNWGGKQLGMMGRLTGRNGWHLPEGGTFILAPDAPPPPGAVGKQGCHLLTGGRITEP